jgi:hypothetical protein
MLELVTSLILNEADVTEFAVQRTYDASNRAAKYVAFVLSSYHAKVTEF